MQLIRFLSIAVTALLLCLSAAIAQSAPKTVEVEATPSMREALYKQVWSKIANEYIDQTKLENWANRFSKYDGKLNTDAELDAALKELVGSVGDRWTQYKSPSDMGAVRQLLDEGNVLAGIITRKHKDGNWHIDGLIYGSAAHKSELKEGDVLISVNGKKLDKLSEDEVMMLLSGKPDETLNVVAQWDGQERTVELKLFPPLPDRVLTGELPDEVLYIRLPTFEEPKIVEDFANQLKSNYFAKKGALTGIVLDLRNNGGGLFEMALKTSSLFLESGTITKSITYRGQAETVTEHKVRPMPRFARELTKEPHMIDFLNWLHNTPMVILINGSTASSSEVTAGALQDNKRAYVIGTHSFGKSVGFNIHDLPNGGRFLITSLKYLTPSGRDLVDRGILPDQIVEQPRKGTEDLALKAAHEYVVKLAAKRSKQVNDTTEIALKPAEELNDISDDYTTHAIALWALALLSLAVAIASLLKSRNK